LTFDCLLDFAAVEIKHSKRARTVKPHLNEKRKARAWNLLGVEHSELYCQDIRPSCLPCESSDYSCSGRIWALLSSSLQRLLFRLKVRPKKLRCWSTLAICVCVWVR
jgi:hypothetical protein